MKKPVNIEFEYENIKSYIVNDIAVLKIKCNAFSTISNLEEANRVLPWFDEVERHESIKGVLAFSEKSCLGEIPYEEFLSEIAGRNILGEENKKISKFEKKEIRAIEINTIINLIRKIISFKKIFITAINGEVVTPFFGLCLAADFRFGSSDMRVLLSHVDCGLHPSGALPFLLPKYLNQQLSTDYLIRGGKISAEQALKLNLVNKIFPAENFEMVCIENAVEYCNHDLSFIKLSKMLINRTLSEFEDYVKLEANYTFK